MVVLAACHGASAQPSGDQGPDRFRNVKRWVGSYSIQLQGTGSWKHTESTSCTTTVKTSGSNLNRSTTVEVELDELEPSDAQNNWSGRQKVTSRTDFSYEWETVFTDRCGGTSSKSNEHGTLKSKGPLPDDGKVEAGLLIVDFEKEVYDITMRPIAEPVRLESSTSGGMDMTLAAGGQAGLAMPVGDFTTLGTWVTIDPDQLMQQMMAAGGAKGKPLPDQGFVLEGTRTERVELVPINGLPSTPKQYATTTFTWKFDTEPNDLRVIVEPQNYDRWLPQATKDENVSGNQIEIVARLVDANNQPAVGKARLFRFELLDVSKQPGVAVNQPIATITAPKPDLAFEQEYNPNKTITGANRDKLEVGEELNQASAIVSSFDWGAWGRIKVTAVMPNGRQIVGKLEGQSDPLVRLPKREASSKIGDAWKTRPGADGADLEDEESLPAGDGDGGDGFTLYEEYRGFYEKGRHIFGDPQKKDFFIRDEIGGDTKRAIALFRNLSELAIHDELEMHEFRVDRVINSNFDGETPRQGSQHGIKIVQVPAGGTPRAVGGPGAPKKVDRVEIPLDVSPGPAWMRTVTRGGASITGDRYAGTIAHELFHACNVWHHGQLDEIVDWVVTTTNGVQSVFEHMVWDDGNVQIRSRTGAPIRVLTEGGAPKSFAPGTLTTWLGIKRGEHSGFEDCVMRYDTATAYVSDADPVNVRYYTASRGQTDELTGQSLCTDPAGTGVNDPGRRTPQPRFHGATKGACKHQVCVNDRYH
jgi:hypothetical protein